MVEKVVQEILQGNRELFYDYINGYKDFVYSCRWICLGSEERVFYDL